MLTWNQTESPLQYETETADIKARFVISDVSAYPKGAERRPDKYWRLRVIIDEKESGITHIYSKFPKHDTLEDNLEWASATVEKHVAEMHGEQTRD